MNGPRRVKSFVLCRSGLVACFVEKAVFGSRVLVGATSQRFGVPLEREDTFRDKLYWWEPYISMSQPCVPSLW